MLGKQTVVARSESSRQVRSMHDSANLSRRAEEQPLMSVGDLLRFPLDEVIVLPQGQPPIRAAHIRYYADRQFRPLVMSQNGQGFPYPVSGTQEVNDSKPGGADKTAQVVPVELVTATAPLAQPPTPDASAPCRDVAEAPPAVSAEDTRTGRDAAKALSASPRADEQGVDAAVVKGVADELTHSELPAARHPADEPADWVEGLPSTIGPKHRVRAREIARSMGKVKEVVQAAEDLGDVSEAVARGKRLTLRDGARHRAAHAGES